MGKTILRVLDGTVLSPALSSKLEELLPGYTVKTFQAKPNYANSIKQRIESLHAAYSFILEAHSLDPKFTHLTKQTLKTYADEAMAACDLDKVKFDELHKELEKFTGALVSAIQIAWPWSDNDSERTEKAIACLNEAEQYVLMSKGRPNTATLSAMDFGRGSEYVLQIDEALPAYYDKWLEELSDLKTKAFPLTPSWFSNLQAEEQAYLCNLGVNSVTPEVLIADLQALLEDLPKIRGVASNWSADLEKIHKQEFPLPDWFNKISKAKQQMLKILAGKSGDLEGAITAFQTFLTEKNTNASFKLELNRVITLPQWYLLLSKLQQGFLKHVVVNAAKIEDAVFFLSSRHRTLPAPANFASHRIVRINTEGEAQELSDRRYRSSHIVSRDLIKAKLPKAVRQRHSISNLEQVMRYAAEDQELLLQTLISPLGIGEYIPSLLTPYLPELPPDKELYDELRSTVLGSKYATRTHQHNHPFNVAKRYYYTEGDDEDSVKLIRDVEAVLEFIDEVQQQINSVEQEISRLKEQEKRQVKPAILSEASTKKPSPAETMLFAQARLLALQKQLPKFHAKKNDIGELIAEYTSVLNSSMGSATVFDYQGRELFLSSLEQLIILNKKGYPYGSCVSGKDRKAIELIHTDSMLIYKARYGVWPTFTDGELARKRFVTIVADLYLSRHQHELAGQNAPGSDGIKTPKWYLPKDICSEINRRLGDEHGLRHDDRLATDNEVKHIFITHSEVITPELELNTRLICKQLGEPLCRAIYDALYKLIDQARLFEVPTRTKVARSLLFLDSSTLPEGIEAIRALMHNELAGDNNIQRLAKIISIVLQRPLNDKRKNATVSVYDGIRGLCKVTPDHGLVEHSALIIKVWTELFENAKASHAARISPSSSDDESVAYNL